MPIDLLCHHCGQSFRVKPRDANQRHCSIKCRREAVAAPLMRVCQQCGVSFRMEYASEGKFCSLACYTEHRRSLPPEQRAALMTNATARIRGAKRTHEDLCNRAKGKQRTAKLSGDEAVIYDALVESGLQPVPLLAVDKFNVDFGFPDAMLAVEYHGGNWHNTPSKRKGDEVKRQALEGLGWTLVALPRLDKPQANNAGNVRIGLAEIVATIRQHLNPRQLEPDKV